MLGESLCFLVKGYCSFLHQSPDANRYRKDGTLTQLFTLHLPRLFLVRPQLLRSRDRSTMTSLDNCGVLYWLPLSTRHQNVHKVTLCYDSFLYDNAVLSFCILSITSTVAMALIVGLQLVNLVQKGCWSKREHVVFRDHWIWQTTLHFLV